MPVAVEPVADPSLVAVLVTEPLVLALIVPPVVGPVVAFVVDPVTVAPSAVWVVPPAPDVTCLVVELPQAAVEATKPKHNNECLMPVRIPIMRGADQRMSCIRSTMSLNPAYDAPAIVVL